MTYQRAVVNCKRCYELANLFEHDSEVKRLRNETLWIARNEAMKALEETFNVNVSPGKYDLPAKNSMERNADVSQALDACINCDFKKSNIAEIFQPKKI